MHFGWRFKPFTPLSHIVIADRGAGRVGSGLVGGRRGERRDWVVIERL